MLRRLCIALAKTIIDVVEYNKPNSDLREAWNILNTWLDKSKY